MEFHDNSRDQRFLCNGFASDSDPNYLGLTYANNNSKKIRLVTYDISANNFYSQNDYEINKWYHLVITRSGSAGKLYINGVLENSEEISSGDIGDINSWLLRKGHQEAFFKGKLDNVRIYNRVLTSEEVSTLSSE